MKIETGLDLDPTTYGAIEELAATIKQAYPEASFRISRGEDDAAIVQLVAVVDLEDTEPVLDLVMDRVLDLQDAGLPIFVVTERPRERTLALRETAHAQRRMVVPTALS
jgi:hypothetical protein